MKTRLTLSLLLIVLGLGAAPVVRAQDTDLKQRLELRLPAVDDLRRRQIVGENNQGYLEIRGTVTADEAQVVDAENLDRSAVYELIARRSETTKETVGRARAKAIAAASAVGVWLQDADGRWAAKR